jgi:hypothetical protein
MKTLLENFEALSNEMKRPITESAIESWQLIKEHPKLWLYPVILMGLLLATLATCTDPMIEPFPFQPR